MWLTRTVRHIFFLSLSLKLLTSCADMDRSSQSSHSLYAYFVGKLFLTLRMPQKRDSVIVEDWQSFQVSNLTSRFIGPFSRCMYPEDKSPNFFPSAILCTQSKTLFHPWVGPSCSSKASQQVLIEALPPVLVPPLKRFLYDTAARGIVKIGKPVQFTPEFEIPLGTCFFFSFLLFSRG